MSRAARSEDGFQQCCDFIRQAGDARDGDRSARILPKGPTIETSFKLDMSSRYFSDENEFIDALNDIFRSEASPYQVTHGVHRREPLGQYGAVSIIRVSFPSVVRVDDEVAHTEAVEPALSALSDPAYVAANDEFRKALEDYRQGDFEDCLGKSGSAFESVLKVLCTKNNITFDPNADTAGPLLDKVMSKSTLDAFTFKEPMLAIVRMRNRLSSSHGGGTSKRRMDRHIAQFALTTTAAAIVLLVQDMGK